MLFFIPLADNKKKKLYLCAKRLIKKWNVNVVKSAKKI